jgi:ABC-2 type transport system permease protein
MYSIFKKEFDTFFTSAIGYLVIGLFLLFNGLILWFFKGSWNIFNTGFADMQGFFDSTPWLLLLLIPAITMRSFSDEYTTGTIEILKTKPISDWQIVLGKFWATFVLIVISLLPTLLYALSISKLATPATIDWGSIFGSYLGLIALALSFSAIGLFTSILSTNQIISFLLGVLVSFLLFYGIEQWAIWYPNLPGFIQNNSLLAHYNSVAKGVLDSRDILYFLSICFLFLYLTKIKLDK